MNEVYRQTGLANLVISDPSCSSLYTVSLSLFPFSLLLYFSLSVDLVAEAEPGDAAVSVAELPAAAAGPLQPGAGAPEPAAPRTAAGVPAQGTQPAGGPLLRHAGPGGDPPARPQGEAPTGLSTKSPVIVNVLTIRPTRSPPSPSPSVYWGI